MKFAKIFSIGLLATLAAFSLLLVITIPTHADIEISDGSVTNYWHFNTTTTNSTGTVSWSDHAPPTDTITGQFATATYSYGNGSSYLLQNNFAPDPDALHLWVHATSTNARGYSFAIGRNANNPDRDLYLSQRASDGGGGTGNYLWFGSDVFGGPGFAVIVTSTIADGRFHQVDLVRRNNFWYIYLDAALMNTAAETTHTMTGGSAIHAHISHEGFLEQISGGGLGATTEELLLKTGDLATSTIQALYNSGNGQKICLTEGCGPAPTSNFYAQIKNTSTLNLRSGASTSTTILKTLPADWVVYVSSTTNASGTPVIADGYRWYQVLDLQGGTSTITGWMAASSTTETYLYYSTTTLQSVLATMASTTYSASSTRAEKIVEAVNWYWSHVTSTDSLYNTGFSAFYSPTSTASSTWIFPKELFFAMASQESGGVGFDNQYIHYDYGHGIMQLTPTGAWAHEPDNWASNAEEVPTYGSHITISPCTIIATTTYTRCYTFAGMHDSTSTKTYKDYGYPNASTTYKFYTNTSQSIYANIKDGLNVLKNKYNHYASSSVTTSSITFQPYEREWLRATWGYNGFVTSTMYLTSVASRMDTFSDYISSTGTQLVATSSFTVDLANKLRTADASKEEVIIFSPVELSITDSAGRITGLLNGKIKEEIPDSAYNPQRKAIAVFFSTSTYTYHIKGIGNGTYGLLINHPDNGSKLNIYAPAIPIKVGEVHTYRVDWNAIRQGQNGVTIKIDSNGDGVIDKEIATGASLAALTLYTAPVPMGSSRRTSYLVEDTQVLCMDGIDNDNDGVTDLADQDCRVFIPPPQPLIHSLSPIVPMRTPETPTSTQEIASSTIDIVSLKITISSTTNP